MLDESEDKAKSVFGDLCIDKRRLPSSKLDRRGIPAYVAEWVLDSLVPGTGELTKSDADKVQQWASDRLPTAGERELIKYRLAQGEIVRILTPVQVAVRLGKGPGELVGQMSLLGLNNILIPANLVDTYPDLLKQGMWGVAELAHDADGVSILSFRPMQATINVQMFKRSREHFTMDEWRALLITSMGYNPELLNEEQQTYLIARLLPLVQKNLHLVELAPKGTGKSYFFENINPKVRLISGGNVSPAVLFVNNANGQWGLLARFAVVVLDEVQTLKFKDPEEVVGGLKGYLANGRITRGGLYEVPSDCSLVMLANISLDERQAPRGRFVLEELPEFLQETAFLDRLRGVLPGWKLPKLGSESFARGVGLKADFFGEALLTLRNDFEADQYVERRLEILGAKRYTRNEDAVKIMTAGLMKLQFPHGKVTDEELVKYCVEPAIHMRQLVWDQLYNFDAEFRQYGPTIQAMLRD